MVNEIIDLRETVLEDKLIAQFSNLHGTSRRTVLEYLKELELGGQIFRKNNEIWTLESYKEKQELENLEVLAKENQEQEEKDNERREENATSGEQGLATNSAI